MPAASFMLLSGLWDTAALRLAITAMSASSIHTAMHQKAVRSYEAEAFQIPDGRGPMLLTDGFVLGVGFSHVNLKEKTVFVGHAFGGRQGSRRTGVRGMAEHRRADQRGSGPPFHGKSLGSGDGIAGVPDPRSRKIDDPLAQDSPQTGICHRLCHLVFEKITVAAGGGARKQHLRARQGRPDPNVFRRHVRGLGREYDILEPLLQRQVVGQTAKKGHREVGVGVDQPGQDDPSAGVDGPFCIREQPVAGHGPDARDPVGRDTDQAVFDDFELIVDRDNRAVGDGNVVAHANRLEVLSRDRIP